jgi:hypothetical protein
MLPKLFDIVAKWTCKACGRVIPFGGELCALCAGYHEGHQC